MLRLTKKTEYGIIAIKYLMGTSEHTENDTAVVSTAEIAERFNIPRGILGKVMQQLARHGLIRSIQGVSGGYAIEKRPDEITLNDVVSVIEGPVEMVECITLDGDECSQIEACNIQSPILTIQRRLTHYFENITLADL